jgi:hypothetical protein
MTNNEKVDNLFGEFDSAMEKLNSYIDSEILRIKTANKKFHDMYDNDPLCHSCRTIR